MEELPKPDPAAAAPSASGARAPDFRAERDAGAAYSPPPRTARGRRLWPLALALALALGGVGLEVARRAAPPPAPPVAAQSADPRVWSEKDFDAATTAGAREALRRDAATHELDALRARPAPASPGSMEAEPLRQALRQLAAGPPELRDAVAAGRVGFYTFRLPAAVGAGGDVYDISVDGVPLLRVATRAGLSSVTLPLDVTKPHAVAQTLVFAQPRGDYGDGVGVEKTPAALADLSLEAPASGPSPRTVDLSVKWVEEPPLAAPAPAAETAKAARCVVHLQDSDGRNEHVIGDFPCDCGAVQWTGNVGSCSLPK